MVTLSGEAGGLVAVEVVSKEQNCVVDALGFARRWLFAYGKEGRAAAQDLHDVVERLEETDGYVRARFLAYKAFREGFRTKAVELTPDHAALPKWSGSGMLAGAYRAGGVAAYFNYRTRIEPSLVELGRPPFETDLARRTFDEADAMVT